MSKCPNCEGSISNLNGVCMDCGFDSMEFEYDEWLELLPPVESYEEAA